MDSSPSSSSPSSSGADCGCRAVLPLLERVESDPAFGRRDAETLCDHLGRCEACADRHGRRVAAAVGLVSFHERRVPTGLLDDLYSAVRSRAPYAPIAGGMSEAFLDGPRALRMWRSAAVAAVILLAVGTSFALSNGFPGSRSPATPVPLTDTRNVLLPDFEADTPSDSRFTTVSWPQHRSGRSFWSLAPQAALGSGREPTSPRRD